MAYQFSLEMLQEFLLNNLGNIAIFLTSLITLIIVKRIIENQIDRFQKNGRLEVETSFLLKRVTTWAFNLLLIYLLFSTFGLKLDFVIGLWVLAGGTIIGFASINTVGNAIAGIILMFSRPFAIGDRIRFHEEFVDIEDIDLIYTRMRKPNDVLVSVPNQMLLETVIENYGKDRPISRAYKFTFGYDEDIHKIRELLIESTKDVEGIIIEPGPRVIVSTFLDYALEYQQKALKHRESTADKKGLARGLKNLAVITYRKDNESDKALNLLNNAMELAKKGKDPQLVINIATDRSKILSKLGLFDEAMKDFVIVRRFSKKYSIKLPSEHEKEFSDLLLNLGFLKYDQGKFEEALKYLKNAALILKTKNDPITEEVESTIQKIELKLKEK